MEAGFLRRRKARFEERIVKHAQQQEKFNENNDDNNALDWFQSPLQKWKQSVMTDELSSRTNPPESEEEKRQVRMKIVQLQQELHDLRTQVLSSTSTFSASSSLNSNVQNDLILAQCHTQLMDCQTLLETTKNRLLPKGKFVFARYRLAMQQQEQEQKEVAAHEETQKNNDHSTANPAEQESVQSAPVAPPNPRGRLENYENVTIQIFNDSVHVVLDSPQKQNQNQPQSAATSTESNSSRVSIIMIDQLPTVLANLKHCRVEYDASVQSLSNIHVVNCQYLVLGFDRAAALHVTDCDHVTFEKGIVQQARLHESSWLVCGCQVTAGAILEGCHNVTFHDHSCQVRDFHWLKPGIPSPNFSFSSEKVQSSTPTTAAANAKTLSFGVMSAVPVTPEHQPADIPQTYSSEIAERPATEKVSLIRQESESNMDDDDSDDEEL